LCTHGVGSLLGHEICKGPLVDGWETSKFVRVRLVGKSILLITILKVNVY
jgi:hypothetical protein